MPEGVPFVVATLAALAFLVGVDRLPPTHWLRRAVANLTGGPDDDDDRAGA